MKNPSRRRTAAIGFALTAILALSTNAQAADKTKTTTIFDNASYGFDETNFSGRVKSNKSSCEKDRKVTVFRKTPGKDTKFGSATTGLQSMDGGRAWQVNSDGYALNGTFYAKTKSTKDCKGDRSKDFEFNDCMPGGRQVGQCRRR